MKIRRDKRIWYVGLGVFAMMFVFAFLVQKYNEEQVDAANMNGFDAGRIISDFQMTNYNSMNEAEIQKFLKSKNSCNDTATWQTGNNIGRLSETTPYSWHVSGGHYVCMADETFNGGTAAHIIWQAAQDYKINPKVLIVLLQKEQGLVTDTLPNSVQYRSATGYGCPDTAACDSKYYGFKNQVRNAAALFREVMDGGWTNYPLGNNYVRYNPNANCGGTTVNIRNLATSALYRYTPYQPNSAALKSSYGGGDGCSAFGNRNFYSYYQDWFGGITSGADFNKINYEDVQQVNIKDGTYNILAAVDGPKSLSTAGSTDGANAKFGALDNSKVQQWQIEKVENYYLIKNKNTGKVLDIEYGSMENLSNVWQYAENRSCAQQWIFGEETGGTVVIHNACDPSYVLDLQDGKSNLQIYNKTKGKNSNQSWVIKAVDSSDHTGVYNVSAGANDGKILSSVGMMDGSNVQTDGMTESATEQWKVEKVDNYYLIRNIGSGKVIDISNGVYANNRNMWQYAENRSCAQRWIFGENSDGTVTIHNACAPGYVLDLQEGKNNLQIYSNTYYNNSNQNWKMRKTAAKDYSGVYNVLAFGDNKKALSAVGVLDGENVDLEILNSGNAAQQWKIKNIDNYYVIENVGTGRVLDVANGVFANNRNLWQYAENDSCAQRWLINENNDGSVAIHNACYTGYVLDLQDGKTNMQIYAKTSQANSNQKWILRKTDAANAKNYSGTYSIASAQNSGMFLRSTGKVDAANVEASTINNSNTWSIEKTDGYYLIRNVATGKVLDVANGAFVNNGNLWQYAENRSCAQRWTIWENTDGTVTIYNTCSPKYVLDLQGGKSNLQIYEKTQWSNANQRWLLVAR